MESDGARASSLPRNQGPDRHSFLCLEALKNDQEEDHSDGARNQRGARRNPFNTPEDALGETAVPDYFTSDDPLAQPVNDVLLLEEDYYDKPVVKLQIDSEGDGEPSDGADDDNRPVANEVENQAEGNTAETGSEEKKEKIVWRFLSVDDIYLSYWKISVSIYALDCTFGT